MNGFADEKAPLLPVACALIIGIATGFSIQIPYLYSLILFAALLLLTFLSARREHLQVGLLLAAVASFGLVLAEGQQAEQHEQVVDNECRRYEGIVVSEPSERPKTYAVDILLVHNRQRVRCYLQKDSRSQQLKPGDALTMVTALTERTYIPHDHWQQHAPALQQLSLIDRTRIRFLRWRHELLCQYRLMGADDDTYGVLAAMTLGDKSALSKEMRDTYAVAGASHVLALSGLHLGILYMLLSWLTFSHRRRHVISQLILVISVWAFAFLVGLPVSIVRSATMISLFAIFTISYRPHLSINLLSLTALLILTIDCSALFDIGFQLSFLSVFSILLLMPLTQKERPFTWQMMRQPPKKHKVVATLRDMLFISIAAQIGTAPLVAYYFGRFATYFLLTNLIVIPAAYLILCGTIVMLILPSCSGLILLSVGALNYLLTQITRLPMASLEGLHPSVTQVFLYYVVVLSLTCILATVRYRSGSPRS